MVYLSKNGKRVSNVRRINSLPLKGSVYRRYGNAIGTVH